MVARAGRYRCDRSWPATPRPGVLGVRGAGVPVALPARLMDRGAASRPDPGAGGSDDAAGRSRGSLGGPRTDRRLARPAPRRPLPAPRRGRRPRRLPSAGRLCNSGPARRSGLGAVALRASPAMTRRVRITQACLAGIALGSLIAGTLPPRSYNKDLQQQYLSGRALRDGIDLFTPVSVLAARYLPAATNTFPHPDPHPPVLALLSVPLTLLPFPVIVPLWLGLHLVLLTTVGRWLGLSNRASLALAAWPPLWCLLYIGQLELLILALALLGWRCAAAGRDGRAGSWLGPAAGLEVYPVVLLVPFAARGRTRLLLAAGTVIALGQLANLATVGRAGFVRYYVDVLPSVAALYAHQGLNSSPYGALLRVFCGAGHLSPIVHAPDIVVPATIVIALVATVSLAILDPE